MKFPSLFTRKVPSNHQPPRQVLFTSLISSEMSSVGEIHLTGNLRIDGRHEGKIRRSPLAKEPITIYISKTGHVIGLIDADVIIIDGHMKGTCKANFNLYSKGEVEGHAFYGDEMEISGSFNAKLQKLTERQKQIGKEQTDKIAATNIYPFKSN